MASSYGFGRTGACPPAEGSGVEKPNSRRAGNGRLPTRSSTSLNKPSITPVSTSTTLVKNKQWTRRVDGLTRRDDVTNYIRVAVKKSGGGDMGNLQGGEKKSNKDVGKSPVKEKKRFLLKKSGGASGVKGGNASGNSGSNAATTSVAVDALNNGSGTAPGHTDPNEAGSPVGDGTLEASTLSVFATDSWRAVNKVGSRDSSSESIFMDPLTSPGAPNVAPQESRSSPSVSLLPLTSEATTVTPPAESSSSLDDVTLIEEDEASLKLDDDDISEAITEPCTEPAIPTQRPTSFTLHKHKKIELGSLSGALSFQSDTARRHASLSEVPSENSVLRKVASLTLEGNSVLDQKLSRPKTTPEKLDYHIYEKFEGQQLLNWFISSFPEDHYLKMLLTTQDFRLMAAQFCNHLMAAGVLQQIPDKDAPSEPVFRADLMYLWTHSEMSSVTPTTPGRLPPNLWSQATTPASESYSNKIGAKYTEADCGTPGPELNPMFASTTSVDKVIRKIEVEEFQQTVMGLKREHKDDLVKLNREQEVSLFKLRGEHAAIIQQQQALIIHLREEMELLKQELERSKTINDIQNLTNLALKDFDSPTSPKNKATPTVTGAANGGLASPKTCISPNVKSPLPSPLRETTSDPCKSSQISTPSTPPKTDIVPPKSVVRDTTLATTPTHSSRLKDTNIEVDRNVPTSPPSPSSPGSQTEFKPKEGADAPLQPQIGPPPPPPMPISGPTPPPMPGMCGPPPPPMPGMTFGPPPPPMPGMTFGPPPPPMPGMILGPPPPPMPGMCGPPPPPMPGMTFGPPPPPMPGMLPGPPPPPMPGLIPGPPADCLSLVGPPPPMPGMSGPPPPPMIPGPSGPTPLPAPPVGGWNAQRAVLRKPPLTPAVPMKPLFWSRIIVPVTEPAPPVVTSPSEPAVVPLWEQLEEARIEDLGEFNTLFSRQITTRKPTKKKTAEPVKVAAAKILDSKRSQNVGILASSLHVDFSEIENAVYHLDTSVISLEALHQIYEARATPEELSMMKAHVAANPDVPLDKPEQFLLELSEIPNFAERIACFMFQTEYEDIITNIDSKLNNIKSVCDMLCGDGVKSIMATILALGNYMNGGNMARGQADGFGLDILPKLRDVKSTDSSVTLLHFLVRTVLKKGEPDDPLPLPEPGDIARAAAVDATEVKADLSRLEEDLETCERKMKAVIAASSEENLEPFKQKMEAFAESARARLKGERDNLDECQLKFKTVIKFYQFRPKNQDEAVCEFFGIWAPFAKDFKDIWKKEQQRLIKEKMQEIKKKQEEKKREIKPLKAGGLKDKMRQKLMNKLPS